MVNPDTKGLVVHRHGGFTTAKNRVLWVNILNFSSVSFTKSTAQVFHKYVRNYFFSF